MAKCSWEAVAAFGCLDWVRFVRSNHICCCVCGAVFAPVLVGATRPRKWRCGRCWPRRRGQWPSAAP
eukprot:2621642-Pyramimonas_sp.AAC.1